MAQTYHSEAAISVDSVFGERLQIRLDNEPRLINIPAHSDHAPAPIVDHRRVRRATGRSSPGQHQCLHSRVPRQVQECQKNLVSRQIHRCRCVIRVLVSGRYYEWLNGRQIYFHCPIQAEHRQHLCRPLVGAWLYHQKFRRIFQPQR